MSKTAIDSMGEMRCLGNRSHFVLDHSKKNEKDGPADDQRRKTVAAHSRT